MKERVTKIFIRVSYILFALFISIALWMFVEITQNELITRDISIPAELIVLKNRDLLESRNLLVASILTEDLTLTFEGPRTEINNLVAGEVTVEVDLENVRSAGTVTLDYVEILPDNVNPNAVRILGSTASQIILLIDRLDTREFLIEANYTGGTVSEEFMAEQPEIDPRSITISGPEEIISKIARVVVPIGVENLSASYTGEFDFVLVDEHGDELSSDLYEPDTLKFSHETIRVTIPIRQLKTITLQVELSHGATTSESNTTWFAEPSSITVSGEPDAVKDLNSIMLGTIDITSFSLTTTRAFPIILPNNLTNVSGETEAMVMVEVIGLVREFRSVANLQTINEPPGHTVTIVTQSLDVAIRGTPANLALIKPENIWIVADLTDFGTGTSRVTPRINIVGVDAEVDVVYARDNVEYSIVVTVTEDNGGLP